MHDRDTLIAVRNALWDKLEIANIVSVPQHQSGLKQALNIVQGMMHSRDRKPLN